MPLAVTHVLSAIIIVGLYRDYVTKHKDLFSMHTVFIAGIGGLLPDIDVPLGMIAEIFGISVPWLFGHGGITHTPFFAAIFLVPALYLWKSEKRTSAMYFFVIFFGIMLHITLDFVLGGGMHEGIMWLFPFSLETWKIHILSYFSMKNIPIAIDAIILVLWLWHEEVKHKISDFV